MIAVKGVVAAALLAALSLSVAAGGVAPSPDGLNICAPTNPDAGQIYDTAYFKAHIVLCTKVLARERDPSRRALLLVARAEAYYRTDALIRSLEDLDSFGRLRPNAPELGYFRALAFGRMGYLAIAGEEADRAIRGGLELPEAFTLRGSARTYAGRYDEAIADFAHALAQSPQLEPALGGRGFAELQTGDIEQAVADFDAALALAPDEPHALYFRGEAHYALDQFDAAIADFTAAQRFDPSMTSAAANIGQIQAIEAAPVAQLPAPGTAEAPSLPFGHTHNCGGYYPFVSERLQESGDVIVRYDVTVDGTAAGVTMVQSSGFDRLDRAAVICVAHHWRNTPALHDGAAVAVTGRMARLRFVDVTFAPSDETRAGQLAGLGRYDEAIAEYSRVIAADPSDAMHYLHRGFTSYVKQDYAAAARDFAKALKLKPDLDDALAARELVRRALAGAGKAGKGD